MLVAALALGILGWYIGRSRFAQVYLVDQQDAPVLCDGTGMSAWMLNGTALGLLILILIPVIRTAVASGHEKVPTDGHQEVLTPRLI